MATKLLETLRSVVKDAEGVTVDKGGVKRPVVQGTPGAPMIVKGGMLGGDSKPFSISNFLLNGVAGMNRDGARHEMETVNKWSKLVEKSNQQLVPHPGGYWLPVDMNHFDLHKMVGSTEDENNLMVVKSQMNAGAAPVYDPEQAQWLAKRGHIITKTMSAFEDQLGGTVVAPPTQGPVIPLVRPKAAFMEAGAQSFALPPQGRHVRPRLTAPPSATLVGEGQDPVETDLSTGQMILQAKKIVGMVRLSEESSAFTSGTLDALVQAELGRTLGLKIDAYAFYGVGGQYPSGITSAEYTSAIINVDTSYPVGRGIAANGNTLLPQYGDLLPALIEERSFGQDGSEGCWVMRPTAYASAVALRANAVTVDDQAGPKVDILRRFSEAGPNVWAGRRVVRSTNIAGTTTKGTSGAVLSDAFYGIFKYGIMASYGAMQFKEGNDGNSFGRGQILIRGLLYGDVGFEYPEAFLWYPYILGSAGQI